jgi:hypothetical protein
MNIKKNIAIAWTWLSTPHVIWQLSRCRRFDDTRIGLRDACVMRWYALERCYDICAEEADQ